jgi:hypothetical protein
MRIKTEINQKKNVRVHIVSGQFDIEALFKSLTDMYTRLPMHSDMNVLWDLRGADGIASLDTGQLNKIITLVSNKWGTSGKSKAALVVSRQVDFGLARLYELQLENQTPSKVRVFKDIKKAVQWIDQGSLS